jgi:hypothetical protein
MKEIQVRSNKGPTSLQKGDIHKSAKIGLAHLDIFTREDLG